ncbi:site-specific DNA-methyltransferase [Vibrio parahaemolyticus]|nr:site-specific DNA-methyltransferase [Vibrio parahaemolyticus]
MSRLTDLIAQAKAKDPQMGADLEREFRALSSRRSFGLNFERHRPENVELPQRPVRKGDKVRVLPPRGDTSKGDQRLWVVKQFEMQEGKKVAHLVERYAAEPETRQVDVTDLVVVAEFRDKIYPGLVSTGKVERGGNKPFHSVINGENYHVLKALTFTHRGKIDAIYIDPPYNTGARDWKYNNDYVESEDLYRHSKWLAFMERRLKLAKELLNPKDSVLIATIDEKENARLLLLLEQVFPEGRIQSISTLINPQGISSGTGEFSRVHEYIHCVTLGEAKVTPWTRSMIENDKEANDVSEDRTVRWADFARYGGNASRKNSPGAFFPIFVDVEKEIIHSVGEALDWDEDPEKVHIPAGTRVVWPPQRPDGQDGRWRVVADTCRELNEKGYIKVGKYNKKSGRYSFKYLQSGVIDKIATGEVHIVGHDEKGAALVEYSQGAKTATPKTLWTLPSHDASRYGSNLIRQFIPGRVFPYPKSLYSVEDILRFYLKKKQKAIVLDFFSGSGTTAHALMRLNKQDLGQRCCISVTNNEVASEEQKALLSKGLRPGDKEWEDLGICDYITKPRIEAAITGRTPEGDMVKGDYKFTDEFPMSQGFKENAEFFTLTYETPITIHHNLAFSKIAPLLWLRAGSKGKRIEELPPQGWDIAETYGVLADLDQSQEFCARATESKDMRIAYIVTNDDRRFQSVARNLPKNVEPVRLYEAYLNNFQFTNGE